MSLATWHKMADTEGTAEETDGTERTDEDTEGTEGCDDDEPAAAPAAPQRPALAIESLWISQPPVGVAAEVQLLAPAAPSASSEGTAGTDDEEPLAALAEAQQYIAAPQRPSAAFESQYVSQLPPPAGAAGVLPLAPAAPAASSEGTAGTDDEEPLAALAEAQQYTAATESQYESAPPPVAAAAEVQPIAPGPPASSGAPSEAGSSSCSSTLSSKAQGKLPMRYVSTVAARLSPAAVTTVTMSMPPLCTAPAVPPFAAPRQPPPSRAVPAAEASSVAPPAYASQVKASTPSDRPVDRLGPYPPAVDPMLNTTRPASLRETFAALSPQQRAAIDQAIFFGMDLRTACALCGKAPSGSSSSPSVRSSSSAQADFGQPELPSLLGAAMDRAGAVATSADPAAPAAPAAARAAVRLAACCEPPPPTTSQVTSPSTSSAHDSLPLPARLPQSSNAWPRSSGAARVLTVVRMLTAARVLLAWGKASSQPTAAFLIRVASRLWRFLERLAAAFEAVLCQVVTNLEGLMGRVASGMGRYLDRLSRAVAIALGLGLGSLSAWLARTLLPALRAATDACLSRVHLVRRYRYGRHLSNGTGALASLVASRAIVRGGPVVASMLASPLRLLYVVLGMDDMRMLFLMLLAMLGSVLRLYRWLGWL